ncbi:major facilitator superfamily domain-containing protein 1-like [Corticium candelabrum]|uniref:major facilitator superfamily domain-containing protein 1-like n=1 Tax=Corticium candelabrum TaxID=121492 RepID=UPI002E26E719|nr:major facilitator superfamily domain-containing protein 1-like [Corticium candelabrum]
MADLDERQPLVADRADEKTESDIDEQEWNGCGPAILCDPRRWPHRFIVLIFTCFLNFGSYFCYDNPAALQTEIQQDMGVSYSKYLLLYSLYSWPNVILCFIGGILIDRKLGLRWGGIVFAGFVLLGQILFALGALFNSYLLMEIGRFVFGIGGESLCVAQNNYAVLWFKGKELNMVFGLQLSFARVGSTVNFNIMKPIYNAVASLVSPGYRVLGLSMMAGVGMCIFSFLCAIILAVLDKRAEVLTKRKKISLEEKITLSDVKKFPITIYMLFIICVAYYVAVFIFIGVGTVFFTTKYDFSDAQANAVDGIVYILSAAFSPIFGFFIDRFGKNVFWVIAAVVITLGSHSLLAFTFINPWIPMVIMGVGYSMLACALWPMVAFVLPEQQLGTAYGFMQAIQNLGLAVVAIVAGKILDEKGYLVLLVFFMACLCATLLSSVLLYIFDVARGGVLNLSAKARIKYEEKKKIQKEKEEEEKKKKLLPPNDNIQ